MKNRMNNLDEKIRGYMAQQAEAQLANRREAVKSDLMGMAQSNPTTAAKRVAQGYRGVNKQGGGIGAIEDMFRTGMQTKAYGPGDARTMLDAAAEREARQNPLYNLQRMLSGTGSAERAGQVAFYGAAAGGATAGLTAAGQGLMALMDYLQQGQQTAVERNNELA
jgi:hypothetical protein